MIHASQTYEDCWELNSDFDFVLMICSEEGSPTVYIIMDDELNEFDSIQAEFFNENKGSNDEDFVDENGE